MISRKTFEQELVFVIENAIREDVGIMDYSSQACISDTTQGSAHLVMKDSGKISGIGFAKKVFYHIDPNLTFTQKMKDGDSVSHNDIVFEVSGSSKSILKAERVVLNAMQRMSAITTKTAFFVNLLKDTKTKLLDTRKTTPCIRVLEKWAVKIGGGENHRFGLYDMIMLKDNHIDYCGGISEAITKTKNYLIRNNLSIPIIIEARSLKEVSEILPHQGIHRILLDNFTLNDTKTATKMINGKYPTETSGNVNEKNIRDYALCGVDYISSGALTHSVSNMDMSLKAK